MSTINSDAQLDFILKYKKCEDAEEIKQQLKRLKASLILLENDDKTACCFKIALGKDQFLEYFIDQNIHLVTLIKSEIEFLENELKDI
jgi:hypothetical protein